MEVLKSKILCIEDNQDTCELITFVFNQAGYEIESCTQSECLEHIQGEKYLAIILDNYFDGMSGIEICREIRSFDKITPIIFFSGEARQAEIDKAIAAGASDYLVKPNDFEKLTDTVIKLIREDGVKSTSEKEVVEGKLIARIS